MSPATKPTRARSRGAASSESSSITSHASSKAAADDFSQILKNPFVLHTSPRATNRVPTVSSATFAARQERSLQCSAFLQSIIDSQQLPTYAPAWFAEIDAEFSRHKDDRVIKDFRLIYAKLVAVIQKHRRAHVAISSVEEFWKIEKEKARVSSSGQLQRWARQVYGAGAGDQSAHEEAATPDVDGCFKVSASQKLMDSYREYQQALQSSPSRRHEHLTHSTTAHQGAPEPVTREKKAPTANRTPGRVRKRQVNGGSRSTSRSPAKTAFLRSPSKPSTSDRPIPAKFNTLGQRHAVREIPVPLNNAKTREKKLAAIVKKGDYVDAMWTQLRQIRNMPEGEPAPVLKATKHYMEPLLAKQALIEREQEFWKYKLIFLDVTMALSTITHITLQALTNSLSLETELSFFQLFTAHMHTTLLIG